MDRGGDAYHRSPRCEGLSDGQRFAEYIGYAVHDITPTSAAAAINDGRYRCLICLPESP